MKTRINSKKALTNNLIIGLIISIITLAIVGFVWIPSFLQTADYESSITQCALFFNSIKGKPAFFGNSLDEPTFELYNALSELCHGKDIEYTNYAKPSAELISDCWSKSAKGIEIFGASTEDKSICLYCGIINGNDNSDNFPEELVEELKDPRYESLKDSSETINLNRFTLFDKSAIPQISRENSAMVLYYIYTPEINELGERTSTGLSKFIGNLGSYASISNFLIAEKGTQSLTGVALTSWSTSNNNFDVKENPTISLQGNGIQCDHLVIPQNIYSD